MSSPLEAEIAGGRLEIAADSISMSISELTNLYREGVLEIRPEFQRLFRWTLEQKSRLVESVLLGIPLPSLFVSQSETGKWELVDGLQRVSTLLEVQGLLKNNDGSIRPALTLAKTKFLPSLEGHSWDSDHGQELSEAQKLDIRLARLDLKVIKRSSDPKAKFDLFQRLNSFGSSLTPQEIRSAMIAGTNGDCLAWLTRLAAYESFNSSVALSERLVDEQYDIELVLRFLMLHRVVVARSRLSDFSSRLDDWSIDLAADASQWPSLDETFKATFDWLATNGGEQVFKKWDLGRQEFRGAFLNTSFEVLALGAGYHIAGKQPVRADVTDAARTLWEIPDMNTRFATGLATQDRLVRTLPIGRKLMADPPEQISPADLSA
jgi:Protein of unknown function DUF262